MVIFGVLGRQIFLRSKKRTCPPKGGRMVTLLNNIFGTGIGLLKMKNSTLALNSKLKNLISKSFAVRNPNKDKRINSKRCTEYQVPSQ